MILMSQEMPFRFSIALIIDLPELMTESIKRTCFPFSSSWLSWKKLGEVLSSKKTIGQSNASAIPMENGSPPRIKHTATEL